MKRIASRDNPYFKQLRRLADDAGSRQDGMSTVLEGTHLCEAFLQGGGVPRDVVVASSAADDAEIVDLLARSDGAAAYVFDDALFVATSRLASAARILMVIERPRPPPPTRLAGTVVLLDHVQDPGNVGSILRSAAAAGIGDVHLSAGCAGAWSPKVVRAAMGAHFALRVFEGAALATLTGDDAVERVVTSPHATRSLHDLDLTRDVAWIFGHEGQGVDPALMQGATLVRIPQAGRMESLNVAAAAAVCLFEQVRQRAG